MNIIARIESVQSLDKLKIYLDNCNYEISILNDKTFYVHKKDGNATNLRSTIKSFKDEFKHSASIKMIHGTSQTTI